MITDLRLLKYIQGRLSSEEEKEMETLMEKNPAIRERFEQLKARPESMHKSAWERLFLNKDVRNGSRVRYTTIFPVLLILILILMITSHWFSRPDGNSTFTLFKGNSSAVELLYHSKQGWRYLDAGYQTGDSLSLSIKKAGIADPKYAIRVFGIRSGKTESIAEEIWNSPSDKLLGSQDPKPTFPSSLPGNPEKGNWEYLALAFDTASLADLTGADILDLISIKGGIAGRNPSLLYQVFRVQAASAENL